MTGRDPGSSAEPSVVGIFVGGASRRMGGVPKGLLEDREAGEPLVVVLVARARAAGLAPVLVGAAEAYAHVVPDVARIADAPAGVGPLGGLRALLLHAGRRRALAIACDMPHVTAELLARLENADSTAAIVAARSGPTRWEPLFARYDPTRVLAELDRSLAAGTRSFQRLFEQLAVAELPLTPAEQRALVDWDTPEDRSADLTDAAGVAARSRPPRE